MCFINSLHNILLEVDQKFKSSKLFKIYVRYDCNNTITFYCSVSYLDYLKSKVLRKFLGYSICIYKLTRPNSKTIKLNIYSFLGWFFYCFISFHCFCFKVLGTYL